MLNERRSRIAIGASLLLIGLAGIALAGAREIVLLTQRHVMVDISNVDSIEQVSVNCSQAVVVTPGDPDEPVDLGWLQPEERVFLSAISLDHNPSWGFRATSNGSTFFEEMQGHAKVLGLPAEENAVVFAKAFTAGGDYLGQIGCQEPDLAAIDDVDDYAQSPDDHKVPAATSDESPYRPRHAPFDQIAVLGRWSLPTLALLGAIAAIGMPSIRRPAWSRKWTLAGGTLAVLGAGFFGVAALPTILTFAGVLLLLAVAILLMLSTRPA